MILSGLEKTTGTLETAAAAAAAAITSDATIDVVDGCHTHVIACQAVQQEARDHVLGTTDRLFDLVGLHEVSSCAATSKHNRVRFLSVYDALICKIIAGSIEIHLSTLRCH